MAATPKTGTMFFRGSKGTYAISIYLSDVANASATWNAQGTSTSSSNQYWRCPEQVVLYDYAQVTGTADTTSISLQQDGATRSGNVLPYLAYLTSINTRPALNVTFPAGALIGAIQNA